MEGTHTTEWPSSCREKNNKSILFFKFVWPLANSFHGLYFISRIILIYFITFWPIQVPCAFCCCILHFNFTILHTEQDHNWASHLPKLNFYILHNKRIPDWTVIALTTLPPICTLWQPLAIPSGTYHYPLATMVALDRKRTSGVRVGLIYGGRAVQAGNTFVSLLSIQL